MAQDDEENDKNIVPPGAMPSLAPAVLAEVGPLDVLAGGPVVTTTPGGVVTTGGQVTFVEKTSLALIINQINAFANSKG